MSKVHLARPDWGESPTGLYVCPPRGPDLRRPVQILRQAAIALGRARVKLYDDRGRGGGDQRREPGPASLQRRRAGLLLLHEYDLGPFQAAADLDQFALGRGSRGERLQPAGGLTPVDRS